jgi:hypothetical protein
MPADPKHDDRKTTTPPVKPSGGKVDETETTPAQERGERLDTGKAIARGGKEHGHVPGADESK